MAAKIACEPDCEKVDTCSFGGHVTTVHLFAAKVTHVRRISPRNVALATSTTVAVVCTTPKNNFLHAHSYSFTRANPSRPPQTRQGNRIGHCTPRINADLSF